MHDLPPLKAVRAFEACYRLGSYTRAAAQLNVQQPAISHQIRLLETDPLALKVDGIEISSQDDRGRELTLAVRFSGIQLMEEKP